VFETLVTTSIDIGTVTSIVGVMVAFTFVMGLIAWATDRTTRATFGFRPNHQKPDRYLAMFSGPVGAPQTPTDSRGALLNRIAVFSTTVI